MTLISRFTVNSHPLLFGDVLISGNEEVGRSPNIPTVGDTRSVYPEGSGFVISGLRQKINIVGANLVIGWAGGRSIAQTIIRELREQNSRTPFTSDGLVSFFKSWGTKVKDQEVGFLGYLIDKNSTIGFTFCFKTKEVLFPTDLFGQVGLIGSEVATDHIRAHLQAINEVPVPPNDRGLKARPLDIAIFFALQVSGVFLEAEMRSHESLHNYFGGGYEVATLGRGAFAKLDDLTYMFWDALVDDDDELVKLKPHKAFKYKYYGDMLAIRTLSLKESDVALMAFDDSIHLIEPIYRAITQEEIDHFVVPSMNSRFLCNYFFVFDREQRVDLFAKIDFIKDKKPNVIFTEIEGGLGLTINQPFFQEVGSAILKRFRGGTFGSQNPSKPDPA
jgi:hypothetical protein